MSGYSLLMLFCLLGFADFVDPVYPPNTLGGGTVIAELRCCPGASTEINILHGEEPFLSSAKAALKKWDLGSPTCRTDLVVVHFRQPNLHYWGSNREPMSYARTDRSLPYLKLVVGPSYPEQGMYQGSVILRAEVTIEGRTGGIDVLRSGGVLTDVSLAAVRQWEFMAAEDSLGKPITSYIYIVFVYRFPVTAPKD